MPTTRTAEPGQRRTTRENRDGSALLSRIPANGSVRSRYRGVQIDARGSTGHQVVPGVQQRFRTQRSGRFLRTTLTPRALAAHPALAATLRRFPDAVLVSRSARRVARRSSGPGEPDGGQEGYVLHGPIVRHPSGQRVFLRLEVSAEGQTFGEVRDARSSRPRGPRVRISRDWEAHPAIALVPRMPRRLFLVSDLHGEQGIFRQVLARGGLVDNTGGRLRWTGGRATLVVNGDFMNKGPDTVGVIDDLRSLQAQATRAGGRLIVVLGNHEYYSIARPNGRRYDGGGAGRSISQAGTLPEDFALGRDVQGRGAWVRSLPAAARVGDVMIVHSGDTAGRTLTQIRRDVEDDIDRRGWRGPSLGGPESSRRSLLFSEGWERGHGGGLRDDRIDANLEATSARSLVAGHNTHMLRPHGRRGRIATTADGRLNAIDSNMPATERDGTTPAMMLIETSRGRSRATEIDIHGARRALWERASSVAIEP